MPAETATTAVVEVFKKLRRLMEFIFMEKSWPENLRPEVTHKKIHRKVLSEKISELKDMETFPGWHWYHQYQGYRSRTISLS